MDNIEDLITTLCNIDEILKDKSSLLDSVGNKLASKVKSNIHNRSGTMSSAVTVVTTEDSVTVQNDNRICDYADYVENGHRTKSGSGWVQGQHMYSNALTELEDEIIEDAENFIDEMLGDLL